MRWAVIAILLMAMDGGTGTATIEVEVRELAGAKGTLWVSLHNDKDAFPSNADKAVQRLKVKVTAVPMRFSLERVAYGEYALAVLHDENDNGKFDRGFLGIPKEAYGVSNNSSGFAAFSFESAKFKVDQPVVKQVVLMRR